jgi:hypothetical protein
MYVEEGGREGERKNGKGRRIEKILKHEVGIMD